jgi:hypothetical protein
VKRKEQYLIRQDTHAHPLVLVSVATPEDTAQLTQWEAHLRPLEQAGFISVWSEVSSFFATQPAARHFRRYYYQKT